MNPGELPLGTLEMIQLSLLSDPENAQRQEAHQVNEKLGSKRKERTPQIAFAMDQLACWNMKFQQKQCHGNRENAVA
jgi:hypothetical protein